MSSGFIFFAGSIHAKHSKGNAKRSHFTPLRMKMNIQTAYPTFHAV